MEGKKVHKFMALAGQTIGIPSSASDEAHRRLGAQLLLSEVLEYVIKGLGVVPEIDGVKITKPDALHYHNHTAPVPVEMVDGLADVAYTMYWNALAFGVKLEQAYERVCDNNLEKFVPLGSWAASLNELPAEEWHCKRNIAWPPEVVTVKVVHVEGEHFAVGKDARGKVRKPSSYVPVVLGDLV